MSDSEFRRQRLQALCQSLGRGGIAKLAEMLDVAPSYVSRLLSKPDTKQHRAITGEMVLAISKLFPDWLEGEIPARPPPSKAKTSTAAFSAEERDLINGFRHADTKDRETMLFIARRATDVFSERAGKK